MLGEQLLDGLKHFFKEEKLSDRIVRIVEINESFGCGIKRCLTLDTKPSTDNNENISSKRMRLSVDSGFIEDKEITENENATDIETESISSEVTESTRFEDCDDRKSSGEQYSGDTESISRQDKTPVSIESSVKGNCSTETDETTNSISIDEDVLSVTENCFSTFPVHSIVLSLSSEYFKKLLFESGMKEASLKTVTVKVNVGEGKHLEKLIEAFYNHNVLKDISLPDLLNVLDIAARFSCVNFIKHGVDVLIEKQLNSVQECDTVLQHISKIFEIFHVENKYDKIKKRCLKYLSQSFYPLELKPDKQELFKELHYITVVNMLKSEFAITTHENNTFVLMYMWLNHRKDTITPAIIKLLLSCIQYELLSVNILTDQLKPKDMVLSQWDGYSDWLVDALQYHSLSKAQRDVRGVVNCLSPMRIIHPVSCYVVKHFVFDQENRVFCDRANNNLIWDGIQLCPILTLRVIDDEHVIRLKILSMSLFAPGPNFDHFYSKFEIYICILPGNVAVKPNMLQSKQFVLRYIRKGTVEFKRKSICNFHTVAKIQDGFLAGMEKYGLNLVLLFKKNPGSWNKLDNWNVKSTKKLIKLNEEDINTLSKFV